MRQNTTIQRIAGLFTLFVFLLSATPKVFFHDLVANHRDGPKCTLAHNITVVHTKTFDCHFDDLVVTAPFVLTDESSREFIRDYKQNGQSDHHTSYFLAYFQPKENRGPPRL